MNKKQVIEVPKDVLLDGIIVDVEKTTWSKIISQEKLNKFENPFAEIVRIKYEVNYDDRILRNDEVYSYYENPMANSKLGMFLNKYEDLKTGIKIKVDYSSEGKPSIRLK